MINKKNKNKLTKKEKNRKKGRLYLKIEEGIISFIIKNNDLQLKARPYS